MSKVETRPAREAATMVALWAAFAAGGSAIGALAAGEAGAIAGSGLGPLGGTLAALWLHSRRVERSIRRAMDADRANGIGAD